MYLQKLEIQGFKSFAAKTLFFFPLSDEYSKGITAVVGPNGSGKSNIADAVRWVLGEQSLKLLRGKKSEDVIFSGSQKKAALGFCEVSLHFNNEDKVFPIDYSSVVITRRLYRSGESEYCINKNKVRLTDIHLLLAQANVGQRSYNVIGQGMVDSIINTPPSERKEFFDEASGIKQYQIKKQGALSRLKTTKEHITQAQILLNELEPKIKFFQRQLKRLEEREEYEKKLETALQEYYFILWNSLKGKKGEQTDILDGLQKKITEALDVYSDMKKKFETLEKESSGGRQAHFLTIQKDYDSSLQRRSELLSRASYLENRLTNNPTHVNTQQLEWLLRKKEQNKENYSRLRMTMDILQKEVISLEKEEKNIQESLICTEDEYISTEKKFIHITQFGQSVSIEEIHMELKNIALLREEYGENKTPPEKFIFSVYQKIENLLKKIEDSLSKNSGIIQSLRAYLEKLSSQKKEIFQRLSATQVLLGIKKAECQQTHAILKETEKELEILGKEITYSSSHTQEEKKQTLFTEKNKLENELKETERNITSLKEALSSIITEESAAGRILLDLQKDMAIQQSQIEEFRKQSTLHQIEYAKLEAHQEDLFMKFFTDITSVPQKDLIIKQKSLDPFFQDHFQFQGGIPESVLWETIVRFRQKLEQIGTIDPEILTEYKTTEERYTFLRAQVNDLHQAIDSLKKAINELDDIMKRQFDTALKNMNIKFNHYFQQLFHGGSAKIFVQAIESERIKNEDEKNEDEQEEPAVTGIEIHATPPGKKLKSMSALSGGEKALTAIALICSIVSTAIPPFIVLDEVDAALDESNALRFASIIQELSTKTQFIIITHNRATMHTAQSVYGVTMGEDGVSHMLSLDIGKLDGILQQSKG